MTANDPLDRNLKKLLSSSQPVPLTMSAAAKARILKGLTQEPKPLLGWRKIMSNKLVRFSAAAALVFLVLAGLYHFKTPSELLLPGPLSRPSRP